MAFSILKAAAFAAVIHGLDRFCPRSRIEVGGG
jgi:hypothetical protein